MTDPRSIDRLPSGERRREARARRIAQREQEERERPPPSPPTSALPVPPELGDEPDSVAEATGLRAVRTERRFFLASTAAALAILLHLFVPSSVGLVPSVFFAVCGLVLVAVALIALWRAIGWIVWRTAPIAPDAPSIWVWLCLANGFFVLVVGQIAERRP